MLILVYYYFLKKLDSNVFLWGKDYMVKLPDDKSFEQGAGLLLQGLTAFSLTTMAYNVKPGDSVLIHVSKYTLFGRY